MKHFLALLSLVLALPAWAAQHNDGDYIVILNGNADPGRVMLRHGVGRRPQRDHTWNENNNFHGFSAHLNGNQADRLEADADVAVVELNLTAHILGTRTATTASYADVAAAVAGASTGDIVSIPAGSATWTQQLTLSKGVTLQGAGTNLTRIINGIHQTNWHGLAPLVYVTSTNQWRITGINFDGQWTSGGKGVVTDPLAGVGRIDHCLFYRCYDRGVQIFNPGEGVIDHSTFIDCWSSASFYADQCTAFSTPTGLGTTNAWYFEDNFDLKTGAYLCPVGSDGGWGARYVWRYNVLSNLQTTGFDYALDAHGNQGSPFCDPVTSIAGTVSLEAYGNKFSLGVANRGNYLRGGTIRAHDNTYTYTGGTIASTGALFMLTDEDGYRIGNPIVTNWPAYQQITNTFFWNNTLNGAAAGTNNVVLEKPTGSGGIDDVLIQYGRDWFSTNPATALLTYPHPLVVSTSTPLVGSPQVIPPGIRRIGTLSNSYAHIDGTDHRVPVHVAVIDTGIYLTHPDVNVYANASFVPNVLTGNDDNGHGTHVAGIIGALDNNIGVVGVAPGAFLWALKALDSTGQGAFDQIISAINYAMIHSDQIAVISMSLGGQGWSDAFHLAVQAAVNKGIVVVVAAGNSAFDVYGGDFTYGTSDDFVPSSFPEAMTISAMVDTDGYPGGLGTSTGYGADDTLATFSNYSESVTSLNPVTSSGAAIDVAAPGVNVLSTVPPLPRGYNTCTNCDPSGYLVLSGTSMSCPHASGAVALYIAQFGRASTAQGVAAIRQAIIDCAEPMSSWGKNPPNPFPYDHNPEPLLRVDHFGAPLAYPAVKITSPPDGASGVANNSIFTFSGSAIDPTDGDQSANLYWYTNSVLFFKGASTNSQLASGSYAIYARYTNTLGLIGQGTVQVLASTSSAVPPVVVIDSPTNTASFASTNLITFVGHVSTPYACSLTWQSSIDGQFAVGTGTLDTTNQVSLSAGTHTITLTAVDYHGWTGSTNVSITVTGTPPATTNYPPIVGIIYPKYAGQSFPQGTYLAYQGLASDKEDGTNISANIVWSSNLDGPIGTGATVTNYPSLGTQIVTASIQDSAGAIAVSSCTFRIYSTNSTAVAPVVTITAPTNTTTVAYGSNLVCTATCTGGLTNLQWFDTATGFIGVGLSVTNTISGNGATRVIGASVVDTNFLRGSDSVTIYVTSTPAPVDVPPVPSSTNNIAGHYASGTIISQTATAVDATTGADLSSQIRWNDSMQGYLATGRTMNYIPADGDHVLSASATDSLGVVGSTNWVFTVDPAATNIVVVVSCVPANALNKQKVTIQATVTAGGSPLPGASCYFTIRGSSGKTTTKTVTTSSNGIALIKYQINKTQLGAGPVSVDVDATEDGYQAGHGSSSFTVL